MTIPKLNPESRRNSASIPGRPRADFRVNEPQDPRERIETRTNPVVRRESEGKSQQFPSQLNQPRMFGRQRQPKGQPLEEIHARVKPETAAWLRELAGDSSIGMLLDHLRSMFHVEG